MLILKILLSVQFLNRTNKEVLMNKQPALKSVKSASVLPLVKVRSTMNPVVGVMGLTMRLTPRELMVDRSYQRDLVMSNARRIAKNWQWNLAGTLSVGRRPDGTFYVYDGQTRLVAAALRGDIEYLNCCVIESTGVEMEAHAFIHQNRDRVAIKGIDYHNAAVTAADPVAVKIGEILAEYGIEIVHSHAGVKKTTGIMNIRGQFARLNDINEAERRLRATLDVIGAAWAEDEKAYSGQFIRGVWRLVSSVANVALLTSKAGERLGRHSVKDLLYKATVNAKAQGCHMSVTIPKVLLEQFNFKTRINRLA